MLDYVTVWNGTIERTWIRSQQRSPESILRPDPNPSTTYLVWAHLDQYPGSTIRQISEAIGRDVGQVGPALYQLLGKGRVLQDGVEETSGTGRPAVRWRVKR